MLEHPLAGPLFSGTRYSKQTEVNNSFKKILIFSFQYLLILISLCSPRAYASQIVMNVVSFTVEHDAMPFLLVHLRLV